ncbi:MAG: Pvc16 family protein [Myxococcales bacterium]|nr:DUF4255 domain-containing protein [Myxococcota bacterium]MDW8281053.1 Pvc16 family protein [Myxococcales bacterium]
MIHGQHHIIKETSDTIGELLKEQYRHIGYKRVHLVVAAPKQDAIEGKLPAVSVYLYNITLDEEGISNNRTGRYIDEEIGPDGQVYEVAREMPLWLRLDYLISCWAQTPEEEQLLLGATIKTLLEHPTLRGQQLKGDSFEADDYIPILLSQKLDEGVLSRFWSSLEQPLKPAIQCWTTIPLYPSVSTPIQRVVDREVRFFDLNRLNRLRR